MKFLQANQKHKLRNNLYKMLLSFRQKFKGALLILSLTAFFLVSLVALGVVLLWGAFNFLRQDIYVDYFTNDFDRMNISAHQATFDMDVKEGGGFSIRFSHFRLPGLGGETRMGHAFTIIASGHGGIIVDGVELDYGSSFTLYANILHQPSPGWRRYGLSVNFPEGRHRDNWDFNPRFYISNAYIHAVEEANGRRGFFLETNRFVCSSFGLVSFSFDTSYAITIVNGNGDRLLYEQSVSNIIFHANRFDIVDTRSTFSINAYNTFDSMRASVEYIDIIRTSGELSFFQAANLTSHMPIRQDLFIRESERGEEELGLSISVNDGGSKSYNIYGMVGDIRISGFSIIPNFRSWLHDNFTIIATSILTSLFGAFGGAHLLCKNNENVTKALQKKRFRRL